jgi:hypothetical protein
MPGTKGGGSGVFVDVACRRTVYPKIGAVTVAAKLARGLPLSGNRTEVRVGASMSR